MQGNFNKDDQTDLSEWLHIYKKTRTHHYTSWSWTSVHLPRTFAGAPGASWYPLLKPVLTTSSLSHLSWRLAHLMACSFSRLTACSSCADTGSEGFGINRPDDASWETEKKSTHFAARDLKHRTNKKHCGDGHITQGTLRTVQQSVLFYQNGIVLCTMWKMVVFMPSSNITFMYVDFHHR